MIQRIQSLYLLLVTALMIAVMCMPLGVLVNDGGFVSYTPFTVGSTDMTNPPVFPVWLFGTFAAISAILAFGIIFLYKKRTLQTILCTINGSIMVIFYLVYAAFFFVMYKGTDVDYSPGIAVCFPLICLILNIMAVRSISKDIALLESLNRIR